MSEMLERVAIGLREAHGRRLTPWSELPPFIREPYFDMARAAIEAMREPAEAMLAAARDPIWTFSQDYAPSDRDPKAQKEDSAEGVAAAAWRAMIDAALNPHRP